MGQHGRECPSWEEGSGASDQLPNLPQHYMKDPLQSDPIQRLAELRGLMMARNKKGGPGLPVSATQWQPPRFPAAFSAKDPSALPLKKPTASRAMKPWNVSQVFICRCPVA